MTCTPSPSLNGERPLRKDAARSRQRILVAAAQLIAARGVDVGYDEIARAAGVGVGTVYRRFPVREQLMTALFAEKFERAIDALLEALEIVDPWEALTRCCGHIVTEAADVGFRQILASGDFGDVILQYRDRVGSLTDQLLHRAQVVGVVREDLTTADLAIWVHLIGGTSEGGTNPETARRYLTLFFDSIRSTPGASTPLPGPALTHDDFERIILGLHG